MLAVENLSYGPVSAPILVRGLSFHLEAGECLHLKGGNGAGKSLLLRTLLGHHPPDAGRIRLQAKVSYLPQAQNPATHLPLTLGEVASAFGQLEGVPEFLERPDLPWNGASGGERQRALLSRALLQEADLLVLDEPFNHLDAGSRDKARQRIAAFMGRKGKAVLLVSHEDAPSSWLGCPVRDLDLDEFRRRDG
jgi:ABC-type Mn2+/Zn2+ transport system ATPase subunit